MTSECSLDVNSLADQFGTPTYVYDLTVVERQIELLRDFDVVRFAQKACSNLAVLDFVRRRGVVVDAVSEGELHRAALAGFEATGNPAPVVYTSDVFTKSTLERVVAQGIHVNLGSPEMILQYGSIAPGQSISLRINPGFGHGHHRKTNTGGEHSKHGIWHEQLDECLQIADRFNLQVTGLHMHIGSGSDMEHLSQVVAAMERSALEVGRSISTISAGGGLPVAYRESDDSIDPHAYFQPWDALRCRLASEFGHPVALEIEPGRFVTAESGFLITEILGIKRTPGHTFYLVDAGFNDLARPILYGAYHQMTLSTRREERRDFQPVVVAGPLCESGDVFTQDDSGVIIPRSLPKARVGERLVIHDAGAYGSVMSSNYNSMPFAAEVAVYQQEPAQLIRRRQSLDELASGESLCGW